MSNLAPLAKVIEHIVEVLSKVVIHNAFHELEDPGAVLVVHQAVVENTKDFMHKEPDHGALALQRLLLEQQAALDYSGEVPKVERVVGFGRGGQEVLHCFFVDLAEEWGQLRKKNGNT